MTTYDSISVSTENVGAAQANCQAKEKLYWSWQKIHIASLYLFCTASLVFGLIKISVLADLHNSLLIAVWQNFSLCAICCYFSLFVYCLASRASNQATFATVGAIVTALLI